MKEENDIPEDIERLVILRLETLSPNKKISIGNYGDFGKEDIIEHVKNEDEIGRKMVEIELGFLRALKEGII